MGGGGGEEEEGRAPQRAGRPLRPEGKREEKGAGEQAGAAFPPPPCGGEQRWRPPGRVGLNEWRRSGAGRWPSTCGGARGLGGGCSPASCRPQAGVGGWRHQADQRWQRAAAGNGELVLALAGVGTLGCPGRGGDTGLTRQERAGILFECLWLRGDHVPCCPRPAFLWCLALCVEGQMSLGRKVKKCSLVDVE